MATKRTPREAKPPASLPAPPDPLPHFPIVGIGASAGGLAAFEAFFSGMPAGADPGMAFILVQHLAPDHESILASLIQRYTRMKVVQVQDGMAVQPNCAYIIPPGRDMAFLKGTLQLLEPSAPRGQRLPIDFFFRSLAQDQRERAICIVLSGTGSDGTLGAIAIKGEGGIVMAQLPSSAEYDGMPRSVIATGMVDYELPPAQMPAQLIAYAAQAFVNPARRMSPPPPEAESALKKVFVLIRAQTGRDFSQYKPSTILRRIERRMAVHQIPSLESYIKYLQSASTEIDLLFRDLLIGVTSFFRDPDVFQALEKETIPQLFEGKAPGASVRVWTPGCSTGEEAYSIAMLLAERQAQLRRTFKIQVFATDIDSRAIAVGRAGLYPASIAADLSPERLARFFTPETDRSLYRIQKNIRDMLVFSEQDVTIDPPFSRLDLITCRNMLIYMGPELQKKLIPLFHYALNPGGQLLLGTSESVGEFGSLFAPLDRKAKLYRRLDAGNGARHVLLDRLLPREPALDAKALTRLGGGAARPGLREAMEKAILQYAAPPCALVNDKGDILYLHGRTGQFLEPAPGEAANNILKMAREGLRRPLADALKRAADERGAVRVPGVRVRTNGDFTEVHLTVRRVDSPRAIQPLELYLVVLEEAAVEAKPVEQAAALAPASPANQRIAALQRELKAKEEYLQSANEELETSNEELKSSNEEMQSVNEELQSTNEELETSKEELQSVNEELATVNVELQSKVADLSRANNDMNNLLAGTGIGTVFVDLQLRILRFTPAATRIINLIPADVGRPVNHVLSNLVGYERLSEDTKTVLDSLIPKELEVQTRAGAWYLMRILPYRTLDHEIEGAVLTFMDISDAKAAREALRELERNRGVSGGLPPA
jgi:two-component system CheB/CheR fusion protein